MPKGVPRGSLCCPKCGGHLRNRSSVPTSIAGVPAVKRYRICQPCDLTLPTIEVFLEGTAVRRSVRKLQNANRERIESALAGLMGGRHDEAQGS